MKKINLGKIQIAAYALLGVLMAVLLGILLVQPNVEVTHGREGEEEVQHIVLAPLAVADSTAPKGVTVEYRLELDKNIGGDDCLAFYVRHRYAKVWLGDEQVYSVQPTDVLSIATVGCNWVMIPLSRDDAGQDVLVQVQAVYKTGVNDSLEVWLGSPAGIYKAQFAAALPELVISLLNVLIGLVMLAFALYCLVKKNGGGEIFALGMLAVCTGLWRLTYADVLVVLLPKIPLVIYYLSLGALMLTPILLMKSVKVGAKVRRLLDVFCVAAALISVVQICLQLAGIFDIRETLKATHLLIVIGALLTFGSTLWESRKEGRRVNVVWLIGLGMLIDLLLYYFGASFTGLLFTLVCILCYVVVEGVRIGKRYAEQSSLLAEKEVQLAHSRFTTMMSQIRSHFVFNILNAISGMCKYDPQKADETIVCFARYLRSNIDIMQDDEAVTFHADLRHLEDYIDLEQVRFGDKIRFETDIKAENFMLPPLILQPLVENSIKHGLTPKPGGGTVILRTEETNEGIRIVVEDDGVGFDVTSGVDKKSVGLQNVRFRLEHLMHGRLELESEIGRGTRATVTIPKQEAGI